MAILTTAMVKFTARQLPRHQQGAAGRGGAFAGAVAKAKPLLSHVLRIAIVRAKLVLRWLRRRPFLFGFLVGWTVFAGVHSLVLRRWTRTCDEPAAKLSLLARPINTDFDSSRQQGQRRVFITFSTSCSPQQDWQSQALLYTHRLHKVNTELVRLMACGDPSYELPKNNYDRYRVIRTPDYNARMSCDPYSPRNRPLGMTHWLTVQMDDEDLPKDDDGECFIAFSLCLPYI